MRKKQDAADMLKGLDFSGAEVPGTEHVPVQTETSGITKTGKKLGRPRKSEQEKKVHISLTVSPEDRERYFKAAEKAGMPVSILISTVMREYLDKEGF